jgi:hypothetical protein
MQKIQLLYKSIHFLATEVSDTLPTQMLKLYDDDALVRVFIFRLFNSNIVVETLILN